MSVAKFPTTEDIYKRLKNDPNLLPHLATVIYRDSNRMMEERITKFKPISEGGDTSFSRIYYFKYDGKVIWDREKKFCIIDEILENQKKSVLLDGKFKLLTYNILNDKYLKSNTNNKVNVRVNDIIAFLSECGAEIICLQEVNKEVEKLLKSDIISDKYPFFAITLLDDDNIVFLSKFTIFESNIIKFNDHKESLAITLTDALYNMPITLFGVHFTSSMQSNAEQKRLEQLAKIKKYIVTKNIQNFMIMGDFNSEIQLDYSNAIPDKYISFDPSNNKYAKLMTKSNLSFCLDKIFYESSIIQELSYKVHNNLELSDHYPIEVEFELKEKEITLENKIDPTTGLVVIVPVRFWEKINAVRKRNDLHYERWMPHFTLAHGFLHLNSMQEFLDAKHKIKPFKVRFSGINHFNHAVNQTYYIGPDEETQYSLNSLYSKLHAVLPDVFVGEFNPHITLGSNSVKEDFDISWTIDKLHIISKPNGCDYYKLVHTINLTNETMVPNNEYILDILRCYDTNIKWKVGGSGVFGANNSSDLDLVAIGDIDKVTFFETFKKFLETTGDFYTTSIIRSEHSTYIKSNYNFLLPIDVHYMQANTEDISSSSVFEESTSILNSVPNKSVLINGLKQIKALAKSVNVYGAVNGYIPGISWSIMCGHLCNNIEGLTEENFVNKFCEYYSGYNYSIPISVKNVCYAKTDKNFCDRLLMVITNAKPHINTIRTLTKSTKKILLDEIKNNFNGNTVNVDYSLEIKISCHKYNYEQLYSCNSLLNKNIFELIIKLDRQLDYIRPFEITSIKQNGNNLSFSWKIGSNSQTTLIQHYCTKMCTKLNDAFPYLNVEMKHY
jgi:endonuclease/exonuclease/phosphatase family metal-dependent hydrolase/2'-5' RNA ligase